MLQIRALRRQHYFRKLKNQQRKLLDIRQRSLDEHKGKSETVIAQYIEEEMLNLKKVRLIEDKLSYEELAVQNNFSEDEVTFVLNRQLLKDRKDKQALLRVHRLEKQLKALKALTVDGMYAVVDTIEKIDENSKKIVFRHFGQQESHELNLKANEILDEMSKIADETTKDFEATYNSDNLQSDSSGNRSDNDEMNQIKMLQQ